MTSQPDGHSFCKLLPTFVISAGTQVVLKVAKALAGGEIRIDVAEHREELLHIRNDGLPFEEVKRLVLQAIQKTECAENDRPSQ